MSEYQILEDAILSEFKNENLQIDEENPNKIEELVAQFNIYWKNYQDKWTQSYWQVYETLHENNNNDCDQNEISNIYANKDQDKIIFCNDSSLSDDSNKDFNKNFNNKDENNLIINNIYSKDNQIFNSTNHQTNTLINLQEIDAELERINDVSVIKEKKQEEKRRNCFDCTIF